MLHRGYWLREYYLVDHDHTNPLDSRCNCATALSARRPWPDVGECLAPEFVGASDRCRNTVWKRSHAPYESRFQYGSGDFTLGGVLLTCHLLRRGAHD